MQKTSPTKVIIDTDPGVDDALAILLALASPELDVVGITTVCGNVPVGQGTKNLFRLLNLLNPPPGLLVGQGAARPWKKPLKRPFTYMGVTGWVNWMLCCLQRERCGTPLFVYRLSCPLPKMCGTNVCGGIRTTSRLLPWGR